MRTVSPYLNLLRASACASALALPLSTLAGSETNTPAPRNTSPNTLFFSGHSLIDNPLPDDVVAIAQSMGQPKATYNQQNIIGSPLRVRTRGMDPQSSGWSGYQQGKNRNGSNMNVLAELAKPQTVPQRYDTLIVTERHDLVSAMMWEDSVRYLRHYHERFMAANPQATTYFYQPWLSLRDRNDPSSWVTYERAAAPVWRCMANRVNQSLAAEGRADRIQPLAANLALAELIDRATQGKVPGITQASARKTVDSLVADGVHLTRLGVYYMGLVTYAISFGQSPVGAWAPSEVTAEQAAVLQNRAWEFSREQAKAEALTLPQCSALMRDSFCATYSTYTQYDQTRSCKSHFADSNSDNPFRFNASTDRGYWLPAPPP